MSFLEFGGNNSTESTPVLDPTQQELVNKIKNEIQQELATGYATSLVNALTENCFNKCIQKPKHPLNNDEERCIEDCSGKFMRSWNIISQSYISRINQKDL